MSERNLYDRKFMGNGSNPSISKAQNLISNYGNNLKSIKEAHLALKSKIQRNPQQFKVVSVSRNENGVLGQSQSFQHHDAYASQKALGVLHGGAATAFTQGKTENSSSLQKTRRLKNNFEMLSSALKNNSSSKKQKSFNIQSDSRLLNSNSQQVPHQKNLSFVRSGSPLLGLDDYSSKNKSVISQHAYGAQFQQSMKDKIDNCYEVLKEGKESYYSQPKKKTQVFQKCNRKPSLYSQIQLKESPTQQRHKGGGIFIQPRSGTSHGLNSNHPNSTNQPIIKSQKENRKYMKVNDRLLRKFMAVSANTHYPHHVQDPSQMNNSQAILNISTAQDINIYNNSFILNSNYKKQPQSQNQSRSSSLKRGQANKGASEQVQMKLFNPKFGQIVKNINNLKVDNTVRSQSTQARCSSRLSNSGQVMYQPKESKLSKQAAIEEAYTTNISKNAGLHKNKLSQIINPHASSERSLKRPRISYNIKQNTSFQDLNLTNEDSAAQAKIIQPKKTFNSFRRKRSSFGGANQTSLIHSQQRDHTHVNKQDYQKLKSNQLLQKGKQKIQAKEYQQAIQIFTDALDLDVQNMDAKFFRAVSYLDCGQVTEAINELNELLYCSPSHSQLSFILLSIAYKRNNDIHKASQVLTECIQRNPEYADAFLARGQAYIIQEKFDLSLEDFQRYTQLKPAHGIGFIGMGDSLKALERLEDSIQIYSEAISCFTQSSTLDKQSQQHLLQARLKRGMALFHVKKQEEAQQDFQFVISMDDTVVKAHFYIGKILSRESANNPQKQQDAILYYEQVVKYQSNELYTGNALFEIAKLRLKEKDFYEAYFNLKRALDMNFTSKRLQLYKDFTEGVLYLIKRKIKKGVQILSDLLEILVNNKDKKDRKKLQSLQNLVYCYRAYGYVAIEKYELALDDIKIAKKTGKVDQATLYNKLLGKGILRMDHEDYIMATKYFNKASLKFPSNKDPYCLYIISLMRSYSYSLKGQHLDQQHKKNKIIEIKEFMDRAIANCNRSSGPSLYFFRGVLYFELHMFYEALQDFNFAIEEEEEPTASYYLARGRCYACLSILTEAMKDLSVALNIDDQLQDGYIYRGKCAYLLGDNNLSFLDFQRLILTDPKNPMVHIYAGNLLMTTGAYQDAIKAFHNADAVEATAVAAFQRSRCYCSQTDLQNAKLEMAQALNVCQNDKLARLDYECLSQLVQVTESFSDLKTSLKLLKTGIISLSEIIKELEAGLVEGLEKKDSPMCIQIIPNVKRIKMEKLSVMKQIISQQNEQQDFESLSIDVNQTVDVDQLNATPLYSHYFENVFSLEDIYMLRAVFYFYFKQYDRAILDYQQCWQLMTKNEKRDENSQHESIDEFTQSKRHSFALSGLSSKTDLSDVGLCSLNEHETNFNMLLCFLMVKNKERCFELLKELIKSIPNKYQKYFYLIRGLMYESFNQMEKSQKDLEKYKSLDPNGYEQYFTQDQEMLIEPFPIDNRLCSQFNNVSLKIVGTRPALQVRPSFSMPFIRPPNMIPNIDEDSIQEEFNLKQIDAPMPEAPWIKRCQYGIKFTDEVQDEDADSNEIGHQEEVSSQKDVSYSPEQQRQVDDNPFTQKPKEESTSPQRKQLSEQILQSAMVYLVDQEDDRCSDKNRVSLFEDSKLEDSPIEHDLTMQSVDSNEDVDSSEASSQAQTVKVGERDSMVLVGESVSKANKKAPQPHSLAESQISQVNVISDDEEDSVKRRVFSDINSKIDADQDDQASEDESQFRSRLSSIRGHPCQKL